MKKKIFAIVFFIYFIFNFISLAEVLAFPTAELLNSWTEQILEGSFISTVDSSNYSLDINITSPYIKTSGWRGKYFANAIGIVATFKVTQVKGKEAIVGLKKEIGTTQSGNNIEVSIRIQYYLSGQRRIECKIDEINSDTGSLLVLARSYFGDLNDNWSIDQKSTIGFMFIGNEIWFYSGRNAIWFKYRLFEAVNTIKSDMCIFGYADDGSINSTVSDVFILYPNQQTIFFPNQNIIGDFDGDGRIDLREAINALRVVSGIK